MLFEDFPNISTREKMQITENIRVSGCPNACSGHVTVSLGFDGLKRDVDGISEPCFRVFIGGRQEGERSKLAILNENFYILGKHLVPFVNELVTAYLKRNDQTQTFADYVSEIGLVDMDKFYKFLEELS